MSAASRSKSTSAASKTSCTIVAGLAREAVARQDRYALGVLMAYGTALRPVRSSESIDLNRYP